MLWPIAALSVSNKIKAAAFAYVPRNRVIMDIQIKQYSPNSDKYGHNMIPSKNFINLSFLYNTYLVTLANPIKWRQNR